MTTARRPRKQPEFNPGSTRNACSIFDAVKAETPPRLLPLKPDACASGGKAEAKQADDKQGTWVRTNHENTHE